MNGSFQVGARRWVAGGLAMAQTFVVKGTLFGGHIVREAAPGARNRGQQSRIEANRPQ